MSAPGSYLVFDPGRQMGMACCLAGGDRLEHATWRYRHQNPGEAYSVFITDLTAKIKSLPDVQVGMELMTIVAHEDEGTGKAHVDAQQVQFSSGWPTHAQTICFRLGVRQPELIAISAWRSRTHGKTRAPDNVPTNKRSAWLKQQAFRYCRANGWEPDSDNAAEALCMLDYLRILHEPAYAFDRGQSFQQERLFA